MKIVPSLLATLFAINTFAATDAPSPEVAGFSASKLQRLTDKFAGDVKAGTIPGAVVLVVRNGKVAYFQHFGDPTLEQVVVHVVERIVVAVVFEKFAEVAVVVIADRLVERQRLAADADDAACFVDRHAGGFGGFFHARVAAVGLDEVLRHGANAAH